MSWQIFCLSLVMAGWVEATLYLPAQAATVLKSGTTHTETITVLGSPYAPHQALILKADRLAEKYKLQAAETIYRQALMQHANNAGALNGLGKIAYYKTTSSNQNWRDKTDQLHTEAITFFQSALRYQPGYVEAHLNLASVYMDTNRMGEASDELYRALQLCPNSSNALAKQGEWLVRKQQYNDAIPYLKKALKLDSANVVAHYYLGVAQTARNEFDAALQNFNTTLNLQPNNAGAHSQMGLIYEKQGNGAAAVEHFRLATALKPELIDARLKLADYYERRGDLSIALEQLKNVMESSPPDWALTDRVSKLSIKNNQPEQAVKYYRGWLQTHPEDTAKASTGLSLAKTQVAAKRLRDGDLINQGEAQRYADQAVKYQPNNFEARMIKAKLDREIGDKPRVATSMPESMQGKEPGVIDAALSQTDYQPYQSFEKGEMLLARYQFREAERAFRDARRTGDGKRTPMHFGELFIAKGLPGLAEESFQHVLSMLPDNASARLGLTKAREAREQSKILVSEARLNQKKNALPVAVLLLERALRANIENSEAHYMLAEVYEKQDDFVSAADHYYAYLQLEPMSRNADSVRKKIASLKHKALDQKDTGTLH